jgi:predicted alpha/beta hydrolase
MTTVRALDLTVAATDGHGWVMQARVPETPTAALLWLPALGVAARHYLPFAEVMASNGVACFVHEWRGAGSSTLRAGRGCDWGYRELLALDLPASEAMVEHEVPGVARILGGHSLGGQLACCRLALAPDAAPALWLVASGAPYWRSFPRRTRWWLPMAYRFLPWLAARAGALPGRTIRFGGQEARGVMNDWARSALSGRYAARGLHTDLEAALRQVRADVRAVALSDDWLAPESSLRYLLSKMPAVDSRIVSLDAAALGASPDHFAWLSRPEAVVTALAAANPPSSASLATL